MNKIFKIYTGLFQWSDTKYIAEVFVIKLSNPET